MDIIYLKDIKCPCSIGVWEWEKNTQQTLILDIEIGVDFSAAAKEDDLDKTINYQVLTHAVLEIAQSKHFKLLESLVYSIADWIEEEYQVDWLKIRCDKGSAIEHVKNVGVVVERSRNN